MSPPSVSQVVAAHEPQLTADAHRFASALQSFFNAARTAAAPPVAAPSSVTAAVQRWRNDVARARSNVAQLPTNTAGRSTALSYYDALDKSLRDLAKSLEASDPSVAATASANAVKDYSEFERLASRVARLR